MLILRIIGDSRSFHNTLCIFFAPTSRAYIFLVATYVKVILVFGSEQRFRIFLFAVSLVFVYFFIPDRTVRFILYVVTALIHSNFSSIIEIYNKLKSLADFFNPNGSFGRSFTRLFKSLLVMVFGLVSPDNSPIKIDGDSSVTSLIAQVREKGRMSSALFIGKLFAVFFILLAFFFIFFLDTALSIFRFCWG